MTKSEGDSESHQAGHGAVALVLSQTIGRSFGLLFAVVAAHHFLPDQLGRYSTVAALVVFASFFADFGTTITLTQRVSADESAAAHGVAVGVTASAALGALSYVAVVGFVLLGPYSGDAGFDVAIGGSALVFGSVSTSLAGVLDGLGLIGKRAAITFAQSAVVGGGGAAALALGLGVRGALACLALGPLVGVLIGSGILARRGLLRPPSRDLASVGGLLRESMPIGVLGGIAALQLRLDLVLVSLLSTRAETARYDLALRSTEAVSFIGAALGGPTIYLVTRRLTRGDLIGTQRAVDRAGRYCYLVGGYLSAMVCGTAPGVTRLLYGEEFRDVSVPMTILASHTWVVLVTSIVGSAILAAGLARQVIRVSGSVAVVGALGAAVGIPLAGASGAAVAAASAQALSLVTLARFLRRRSGVRVAPPSVGVVAAALSSGAAAWVVGSASVASLLAALVIGTLAFVTVAGATGALSGADVADLRRLVKRDRTSAPR